MLTTNKSLSGRSASWPRPLAKCKGRTFPASLPDMSFYPYAISSFLDASRLISFTCWKCPRTIHGKCGGNSSWNCLIETGRARISTVGTDRPHKRRCRVEAWDQKGWDRCFGGCDQWSSHAGPSSIAERATIAVRMSSVLGRNHVLSADLLISVCNQPSLRL
jgi:hypothetical protein